MWYTLCILELSQRSKYNSAKWWHNNIKVQFIKTADMKVLSPKNHFTYFIPAMCYKMSLSPYVIGIKKEPCTRRRNSTLGVRKDLCVCIYARWSNFRENLPEPTKSESSIVTQARTTSKREREERENSGGVAGRALAHTHTGGPHYLGDYGKVTSCQGWRN